MTDKKISELTLLSVADFNPAADYVPIIDVSEASPADQNKRILGISLLKGTTGATIDLLTGANIASASTINLDTATGNRVHITGTTTITAVTLTRGPRTVIFDGALTLTHHATTNNLPGGANITTAAGDRAIYESDGTTVYCIAYIPANGKAVVQDVTLTNTVTLSNKTLAAPKIQDTSADHNYIFAVSELEADRTVTLPLLAGNDVFVFADFTQTLKNKTLETPTINNGFTEEVYAVSGTTPALAATDGSIQTWTLSGSSTPTGGPAAGQSILLAIDDGTAYTITWTSINSSGGVTWKTDGGAAPTLNTTGYTFVLLWKIGSTVYGARIGDA